MITRGKFDDELAKDEIGPCGCCAGEKLCASNQRHNGERSQISHWQMTFPSDA
jgi:hypothetical protein